MSENPAQKIAFLGPLAAVVITLVVWLLRRLGCTRQESAASPWCGLAAEAVIVSQLRQKVLRFLLVLYGMTAIGFGIVHWFDEENMRTVGQLLWFCSPLVATLCADRKLVQKPYCRPVSKRQRIV